MAGLEMDTNVNEEVQEAEKVRSFLRERFLRVISQLNGKQCTIKMHENTGVSCKTKAFEPNFESVIVDDLQTPVPTPLKKAILRADDILSIHYDL